MPFDWLKSLRYSSPIRRHKSLGSITPLEPRTLLSALPVGPEVRVNNFTDGYQRLPDIAMALDGDFVMTWTSAGQDGNVQGIFAQSFDSTGTSQGNEFQVNTFTTGEQWDSHVAMDLDGNFIIVWTSFGQDGNDEGIFARRFNASGASLGDEFLVNTTTAERQRSPDIAISENGDFVISWVSRGQDGDDEGIYARRFNSSGVAQGAEFLVNTYTTGKQLLPSVAMDADGDFIITWESYQQNSPYYSIYSQRYNAIGVPQGPEFQVNSITTEDYWRSSVAMDADGDFVIAWNAYGHDGSYGGIYARRYNASGTPLESEFQVNTYTTEWQRDPFVAISPKGDFVIAWHSDFQDGSEQGVYAQRYDSQGQPKGSEFLVNSFTTGNQRQPAVAIDADGDFLIAWNSTDQDGSGLGVYIQRYRSPHPDQLAVRRSSSFYLDSNHSKTWNGPTTDTLNTFGSSTDKPLAGDWNGDGYTDIGVWRAGIFYLDANGNGTWDGAAIDKSFKFGLNTDTPLVGDWNGDGQDDIGVWRAGKFYLDLDGNRAWNSALDGLFTFGSATDTPIIGDWNADGIDDLGIWRSGKFYLDLNANRAWNSGVDGIFAFGLNTDTPLIGDWNADGTDDIAVWRNGKFYQDSNGNRAWNSATDTVTTFGANTDTPLIGYWRPKTIPGAPLAPAPNFTSLTQSAMTPSATTPPTTTAHSSLASLLATPPKKRLGDTLS